MLLRVKAAGLANSHAKHALICEKVEGSNSIRPICGICGYRSLTVTSAGLLDKDSVIASMVNNIDGR